MSLITRDPSTMTHAQLARLVREVQAVLWLDVAEIGDSWLEDKEHGADEIDEITRAMTEAGLAPYKPDGDDEDDDDEEDDRQETEASLGAWWLS